MGEVTRCIVSTAILSNDETSLKKFNSFKVETLNFKLKFKFKLDVKFLKLEKLPARNISVDVSN